MADTLAPNVKLSRVASLSGSMQATRGFLRKQLWAWPIIAAIALSCLGWWVYGIVGRAMQERMVEELTTILNADVTALDVWLSSQKENAGLIVNDPELTQVMREIVDQSDTLENPQPELIHSKTVETLRKMLSTQEIKDCGYHDFFLVGTSMRILASRDPSLLGLKLTGVRANFFRGVLDGHASVSAPYRSPSMLPDTNGELKAGLPTMFVAAPVRDKSGKVIAALGLRQEPKGEFNDIFQIARSGETGETYAFDKNGLMLSQSRFDGSLKQIGLLADRADEHSILTVELRDPEVNMAEGKRPTLSRDQQPLTWSVQQAIAGTSEFDVQGYRDYRGVPVIGAWKWLPQYGFGVVTEMDVAEAYRPLNLLRYTFGALFGLLVASAVVIFIFMLIVARQQKLMQKAVLEAKQLGQYTLEEKLGSGGMGTVYRARHALLRRPTAIKLLDPDKMNDSAIARFQREVQLTSQLNHPNTIAIYDYGKTPEGVFFYAMEYLDGLNLEDLVMQHGPLPEGRVISILDQVCGSLAEAHGIGLIHRDIKPANVVVNNRGGIPDLVKVLDFGLVKSLGSQRELNLTTVGTLTGTPQYLAPESIEQPDLVDARADIYAIGAVGYYLLTATAVFRGNSVVEVCMQHIQAIPDPPSARIPHPVSPALEALILACLAKKPEGRPQSAQALRDELAKCDNSSWSQSDAEAWWQQLRNPESAKTQIRPMADTSVTGATIVFPQAAQPKT